MFYAAFKDTKGERHANLYYGLNGYTQYFKDTFPPDTEHLACIDFVVRGNSYAERKECVRNIAIDFQNADSEVSGGLSWGEIAEVQGWFERMGKRYGLLTEFHENCVC